MTVSMKNPQPTSHLTVKDRACPETANKARAPARRPRRTAEVLAAATGRDKSGSETISVHKRRDSVGKSQRPQQKAKQLHELAGHEINTNISYVAIHQQRTI